MSASLDDQITAAREHLKNLEWQKANLRNQEPDWWPDWRAATGAGEWMSYERSFRDEMLAFDARLRARFSPPPAVDNGKPGVDLAIVAREITDAIDRMPKSSRLIGKCYDDVYQLTLERLRQHLPAAPRDADRLAEKITEFFFAPQEGQPIYRIELKDEANNGHGGYARQPFHKYVAALIRDHDAKEAPNG